MKIGYETISTKLNEILYELLYNPVNTTSPQDLPNINKEIKNWRSLINDIENELNR